MEFKKFVRTPFTVEAVEVTKENIGEWAEKIGRDGKLSEKEDGTPFILVDQRVVPKVFRVFPGFFITKMGDNVRAYSPKIFREQFEPMNEGWETYFGGTKEVDIEVDGNVVATVEVS